MQKESVTNTHALLSASSAHRWLECPPSARATAGLEDNSSTYAQEGTDAHALAQFKVEQIVGIKSKDPTADLQYYDGQMEECANEYAEYFSEKYESIKQNCPDPLVLVEQKLDFSRYVPEGFGYVDCLIVADNTMHVIDFKYGMGVEVSAVNNPQMFLYALGGLELFDGIYNIENIKLSIFQPRLSNISEYEVSKKKLLVWSTKVLTPKAALAYKGQGDFKAGEHCRFCKLKSTCRKRAEYNLEMAKYDFRMPDKLSNTEISAILDKSEQFISWINDIKNYALTKALQGEKFEGYKVVAGKSNRKFTDEDEVARVVIDLGYEPYEKKLLSITAMTSLLGKKQFEENLSGLIYKPAGKPTLVTADDKRPEIRSAIEDFKEL